MSQCFWSSAQYKLSWDDARDFCQQMGGDLAEPLHLNALMVHLQDRYRKTASPSAGSTFLPKISFISHADFVCINADTYMFVSINTTQSNANAETYIQSSMSVSMASRRVLGQGKFFFSPHLPVSSPSASAKVFHLGATDLEQEGNWTYISGRPVDPRGWMPGEPNDTAHAQNCLNLCFQGCRASYPPLNDQQCHAKFHFVCEFSVVRE